MSATMTDTQLPDPITQAAFYKGVTVKRLFAWVVDIIVVALMSAVLATLPFFIGWFFYPLIFIVLSFFYRAMTVSQDSATWGMRLFNIELRGRSGQKLETSEAVLHTAGYMVASGFLLPQIASIVLMLVTERKQGLHDLLCGTAAINKPGRY